jgi:hypothetical protein
LSPNATPFHQGLSIPNRADDSTTTKTTWSQKSSSPETALLFRTVATARQKDGVSIRNTASISAPHSSTTPYTQPQRQRCNPRWELLSDREASHATPRGSVVLEFGRDEGRESERLLSTLKDRISLTLPITRKSNHLRVSRPFWTTVLAVLTERN